MKKQLRTYAWLLGVNLFISAFTFGGGYVVIPMIRKYFVEKRNYMGEEELSEMAAVAQSSPGAIAVNLAVLAGYKTAGWAGALVSAVGSVLPPLIILSWVSLGYERFAQNLAVMAVLKGMEAGVAALIVDLLADMCKALLGERSLLLSVLAAGTFVGSYFLHLNVIYLLLISFFLCAGKVWGKRRRMVC